MLINELSVGNTKIFPKTTQIPGKNQNFLNGDEKLQNMEI